jgi:hypothetical protein
MIKVIAVRAVRPYLLDVSFTDGTCRRVDVQALLWGEMFEPLRDPETFMQARFDPEVGTVTWPNEADIAPEYLHAHGVLVAASAAAS